MAVPLSKERLAELNPERIYNLPLVLNYELWKNIDTKLIGVLNNPFKIKFDENLRNNLGTVKDKKGIYMFLVEPDFPFIPKLNYLVYVGRVIKDNTFFKRFYDYVNSIGKENGRRNIQLLTNLWPDKTWVYFYELKLLDNQISEIEQQLFDNIIPPLNNEFRSKQAQNNRSIYN